MNDTYVIVIFFQLSINFYIHAYRGVGLYVKSNPCIVEYSRYFVFSFFFSSRRRHTRLVSDWSSDVCSSDLRRRHTRLVSDWSSDVCSSDLEHTSELQSLTNLVCRLLLGVQTCALDRKS